MPITPRIIEAADTFRAHLLARERRAAGAMVRYYGTAWRRLRGDITALSAEVDAMRLAGEEVTRGKIVRLERMRAIQVQVEQELGQFAQYADEAIVAQKRESILAGERESAALIEYAFPQGASINISHYQMPRAAVENLVGFLQDGSPLQDIITGYVGSAADAFGETMVTGLVTGLGPRQLARELRQAYGMGLTDALRLSRTENLRAYRTASRQTYEANADVLKGWIRHSARDDRVCLACVMLDGTHYDLATDMADHVMGRCLAAGELVLTRAGWARIEDITAGDCVMTHKGRYRMVTATSKRRHDGEILHIRQGEYSARVTPDHPIMTSTGWVEARLLNASSILRTLNDVLLRDSTRSTSHPSDMRSASFLASPRAFFPVLCQSGSSSMASFTDRNAKSMLYMSTAYSGTGKSPASFSAPIKARSLGLCTARQFAPRVLARLRRASGAFPAATRLVMNSGRSRIRRLAASLLEIGSMLHSRINRISDLVLIPASAVSSRYVASSPYRRRSQAQIGSPSRASSSRFQRSETIMPRCSGVLRNPNALARWRTDPGVRPGNSAAISSASYRKNISRITEPSELVHRRPIRCLLDWFGNIIHQLNIKASEYTGLVYDLQVDQDESFIAGGIVVHNCAMLPETKTYAELGIDAPEPQFQQESAREWFERQPESVQRKMMGAGKFDAWKDGKFKLDDIPQLTHSDLWGDAWTPKSLYELLGEDAPVGTYAGWAAGRGAAIPDWMPPRFGDKTEAGQWIRDNLLARPGSQFAYDFIDLSPEQLQTLADVLAEEKQKHGLMFDMILPTSAESNAFAWVQNREVLGEQHSNLTLTFAGADEEIARRHARALSDGFVTEENYADVIRHEYGHLMLFNDPELAQRAEELYLSEHREMWVQMSRYAAQNYHEMFAESYSMKGRNWMADKVMEALGL